ncbi:MAG TPA: cytochrome c maturation protein CcmE [Terriglobia bacterium]|nr:cytochrome c maturation protein CcmE [Terriglobia bacterium]HKT11649.1 cytochrome c maturation protein CcmE [Terriglobia bacterium]
MANKNKKLKFGIGIAIILAAVGWEAVSGFQQSKTYYVTVKELTSGKSTHEHVRVGGIIVPGSIHRSGEILTFRISQEKETIPVTYVGKDTLPDDFKGGANAIVEGSYLADGTFRAQQVQAKCASKYQAAPPAPKETSAPSKVASYGE